MAIESSKPILQDKVLLIVEDDKRQLDRYCNCLSKVMPFDVACSREEAFKKLSSGRYDFLLSDMHLTKGLEPKYEGLEVMTYAKGKVDDITICAMSTDTSVASQDVMHHFVEKPIRGEKALVEALVTAHYKRVANEKVL